MKEYWTEFNMRPTYQVSPDYAESTVKIRFFREPSLLWAKKNLGTIFERLLHRLDESVEEKLAARQ